MGKQAEEAESNGCRALRNSTGMVLVSNGLQQPGETGLKTRERKK